MCTLSRLASECRSTMIRTGSSLGLLGDRRGIGRGGGGGGGYTAAVHSGAASSQTHLSHTPPTHTHTHTHTHIHTHIHITLIAFPSFITFIASPLHCMLPRLVERSMWWRWAPPLTVGIRLWAAGQTATGTRDSPLIGLCPAFYDDIHYLFLLTNHTSRF